MAYVLPITLEDGTPVEVPLQLGTLGYPHVILRDEDGNVVEIPNDPPEAPPTGRFRILLEDGSETWLDFAPGGAIITGGPLVLLTSRISTTVDFERAMPPTLQLGDAAVLAIQLQGLQPGDLTGATLEIVLRRGDGSALVKGASEDPSTANRVLTQLQAADVQSAGEWVAQAKVVLASGAAFKSTPKVFEVKHNLPES